LSMKKNKSPYAKFGAQLKDIRGRLYQREVAEEIGLSAQMYAKYEAGEYLPDPDTLSLIIKFCKAPHYKEIKVLRAFYRSVTLRDYGIDPGDEIDGFIMDLERGDPEALPNLIKKRTASMLWQTVEPAILGEILEIIESLDESSNFRLTPKLKAEIISEVYEIVINGDKKVDRDLVESFFKIAVARESNDAKKRKKGQ
jgi:transcriptional regulator with XRE-family HTH domain